MSSPQTSNPSIGRPCREAQIQRSSTASGDIPHRACRTSFLSMKSEAKFPPLYYRAAADGGEMDVSSAAGLASK